MSAPLSRLPSLDLLRGFVAVGRRMSITQAAEDLHLTQSAVSRQVQALEAFFGLRLFTRRHRAIAFTAEGERLFRQADAALRQLQDAVGELRAAGALKPVTLSAAVGVTSLWLLPRLRGFHERHPGVDVRVSASGRIADLRYDGIDLAIRYAAKESVPAEAQRLFGETVTPVAHPVFGGHFPATPEALSRLTLLEFDEARYPWLQWKHWLAAMGWAEARPKAVLRFNQYDLVIQAAIAGQGIALGRLELIREQLDEGRLQVLHCTQPPMQSAHGYWLIPADAQPRREVRLVAEWILAESACAAGDVVEVA